MAIPAGMFKPSQPTFYVVRVRDGAGNVVPRPYGMWATDTGALTLAAVQAGYRHGGTGLDPVIRTADRTVAAEHFGLPQPAPSVMIQALDAGFNWDGFFV